MDASDKSSRQADAERRERRMKQLKEVEAATSDVRASLQRALQSDGTGTYKKYQGEIRAITGTKGDERKKGAAIAQINNRYRDFFKAVYSKAGINEDVLRAKIAKIFSGARSGEFLTLAGREPFVPVRPIVATDLTLGTPYTIYGTRHTTQGLSFQTATAGADSSNGRIDVFGAVAEGAGGTAANASVGHVIDVPAGFSRVEVTVTLRADYSATAMGLLGVAGGWVDGILEAEGAGGNVLRNVRNFGYVVAPVAWFADTEGDEQFELAGSFSVPSSGGHFQIKASVTANTYTVLNGWSMSSNDAQVSSIRVHFVR
jgi:hypothetical protein